MTLYNATKQKPERVSHIYQVMGARREKRESAQAGEIVALVGLKYTATGHTLCDATRPVVLEEIRFPEPVISQALLPGKNTDEGKLADALSRLVRDDPTLRARTDPETGELILSGMGELHLEVAIHKLRRDFQLDLQIGKPMVAYRQTLARAVELEHRHIKQRGGRGQYAVIVLRLEPLSPKNGKVWPRKKIAVARTPDPMGLYFEEQIIGGAVPNEYIPAVEEGFRQAARRGAHWPFPSWTFAAFYSMASITRWTAPIWRFNSPLRRHLQKQCGKPAWSCSNPSCGCTCLPRTDIWAI
jgi:elongation factor G